MEQYNISDEEMRSLNDYNLIKAKQKQLNEQIPNKTLKVYDDHIDYISKRYIFLDDQNKLEISITDINTVSNSKNVGSNPSTYKSTYKLLNSNGVVFNQYVGYYSKIFTVSHTETQVVDTYGTYNGIGTVDFDNSHSVGYLDNAWARTSFNYHAPYLQSYVIARSYTNYSGWWSTDWEV